MLTHDELVFCLKQKWPNSVHCKDYFVAMPVDAATNAQTGQAFIAEWSLKDKQPTQAEIDAFETDYATELEAFRSKKIVPQEISDRQFFQQLAVQGLITEDEAIAAASNGALPQAFIDFIGQLPADQQFAAKMALQGATSFLRSNPLVATFGQMQGMTDTQIDDLWIAAAKL